MLEPGHLHGRVVLVTGVSRRVGIGFTVANRLEAAGATVVRSGWSPHDAEQPWGEEAAPVPGVRQVDLEDPAAPAALVDAVVGEYGGLDGIVAVHARSSSQDFAGATADELDRCWAANVRSVVLLAQRFAAVHPPHRPGGRMIWFTSGQHLGPMDGELAYAVSKGALHAMTLSVAAALAARGIVANCINPGPVDTGYTTGEIHDVIARRFPARRWGTPDDVANLVEFLVSDAGAWVQAQVINSEGGFRLGV